MRVMIWIVYLGKW